MARRKAPKRKDKRIFKKTANKTQSFNVTPVVMRGGIRL